MKDSNCVFNYSKGPKNVDRAKFVHVLSFSFEEIFSTVVCFVLRWGQFEALGSF